MVRHLFALVMALGLLGAANGAAAQVTYNFQGGLYDATANGGACVVGDCTTFTTAHRATATITFGAPLAPNLTNVDVSPLITAYSFSDGVNSTTGPGPIAAVYMVVVTTDGAGLLIDYTILLERTPGPPYPVGTAADPNSRFSYLTLGPAGSSAFANAICIVRGGVPAAVSGPGACNAGFTDGGSSTAISSAATTFTIGSPATVPTLSEWAMIVFGLLLAGGAAVTIQRRRLHA